MRWFSAIY